MSNRLTVKAVENIKARGVRREVPDGEIRGMYLVVQPSGAKSYVLRYRHAGRPRKLTIGPAEIGLAEARKAAAGARAAIAAGKDPQGEKAEGKIAAREAVREVARAKRDSVEAVVAEFVEKHVRRSNKPSTAKEYERLLEKEIVGPWRGRLLSDISRRDVNRLLDDIVARGAPIAANRVLAILRKFCRWATAREIIERSPCDGVMTRATETPRDRVLEDRELSMVWRGAADTLGWPFDAIVRLLILTGARRGEIVGMAWPEVDLGKKLWSLPAERVKNGRPHALPLSSAAIEILSTLPRIAGGELVFPAGFVRRTTRSQGPVPVSGFSVPKRRLDGAIAELAEAEGSPPLAQWGFHDLRRSCASGMAKLGVDLHVIERCLNHVSGTFGGIVSVYQKHKFEDGMRAAMDLWAAHIERLVSGATAANVVELAKARV